MNSHKKILIAEDDLTAKIGLETILNKKFDGNLNIFNASNGKEALEILEINKIDILITDINMYPINGLELIEIVIKKYSDVKIIVLTAFLTLEYIKPILKLNISVIYKINGKLSDIHLAIDAALNGGKYISNKVMEIVEKINEISELHYSIVLGDVERRILKLLSEGKEQKNIIGEMNFSLRTLNNFIAILKKKFEVKTIAALIAKAKELKII